MSVRRWPIRLKLTMSSVIATLVVLAIYAVVIFAVVQRSASNSLDERVRSDFRWATEMWQRQADGSFTWFEGESGDAIGPWLQVWDLNGELLHRTRHANWYPIENSAHLAAQPDGRIVSVRAGDSVYRVLTGRSKLAGQPVIIQVAESEAAIRQGQRELAFVLLLGLPLAIIAAGIGGFWLARGALAPIGRLSERTRSITVRQLHDRLPIENPNDELGRLAAVINEMLARLESSFGQMQRFTADVSHELRTPLMAMRTVGEVGLRNQRDPQAYRDVVGSMLEEVERLTCLVDRLLAFSRAETGATAPSLEVVDLRNIAVDVTSQLGVLAEEKQQTLAVDQHVAARALADPLLLRQAVANIVDNAIKYSPAGSQVAVRVWAAGGQCGLEIQDEGPGIAPGRRARIFDRFYRGAAADGQGSGLGLGIARWAVDAMGGQLTLATRPAHGSLFRITLPEAAE